ncbi:MAG: transglycosylase SLT domain-containing protein [Candidatus Eremiobacteraeota bacterium]|nr:transglycosylase SLT domain-containing protein [Candidatus Eremiobacteraeota bacterium]
MDHESGFNPSAVGDNGTSFGLGQVHTPAHPDYNVQQALHGNNGQPDVLYQLEYSAHMLVQLHQQYGSWQLAVEHYNGSGPQAVQYSQNVMGLASQIGQNANALG